MYLWQGSRAVRVESVTVAEARGWSTPLTREGTIVVNGVAASSYTNYGQTVSHWLWAPLRVLRSVMPEPAGKLPHSGKHVFSWAMDNVFRGTVLDNAYVATAAKVAA